jgi:twin BRCT domain
MLYSASSRILLVLIMLYWCSCLLLLFLRIRPRPKNTNLLPPCTCQTTTTTNSYTRDLTSHNTHLIASEPCGAKYEVAKKQQYSATGSASSSIVIVNPLWVDACYRQRERVPEVDYALVPPQSQQQQENNPDLHASSSGILGGAEDANHPEMATPRCTSSLEEAASQLLLEPPGGALTLLSSCQFVLLGFHQQYDDDSNGNSKLYQLISRVVRRYMGTIYWELQASNNFVITHVIVNDNSMDETSR